MGKTRQHKSEYWQAIRGVCILVVIMIHCPTGQEFTPTDTYAWLILRQFINFPVALFIFMAGYFVNVDKAQHNTRSYALNRGGRLLVPYLVWSSVYIVKDWLITGEVSLKHIIYAYCTGKAATPFYYIVVLVQLTLLTPWLVRMKNRRWLYMVTPTYLVILYIYNLATGSMPRLYETVFPAWFSFYVLGLDCRSGKWVNVCRRAKNWWIAAVLGLSIIEAFVLLRVGCAIGFASSQIRFGSFLYAGLIALVLMKGKDMENEDGKLRKLMVSIGDCSYGIFYVHILVLIVVRKIISALWVSQMWIYDFLICFVLTAAGSYLIVWVTKRIAEKIDAEKVLRIIGF